jgi:hypothetical protein
MAKLRIKADKELSELERFGFHRQFVVGCCNGKRYQYAFWNLILYRNNNSILAELYINESDRILNISITESEIDIEKLGVFYDLIQADLVEKVEEGE